MMEGMREYLIAVTAAAILCGIVTALFDSKDMIGSVVRMLAGICMVLVIVSPVVRVSFDSILDITDDYQTDAKNAQYQGQLLAENSLREGIKQRTQAYILDKAGSLGLQLKVEVDVSEDALPRPQSVYLEGEVSPLEKQRLTQIIQDDLGIVPEEQIWI